MAVLVGGCQGGQVQTIESLPGSSRDAEVTCPGGSQVTPAVYDYVADAGAPTPEQAFDMLLDSGEPRVLDGWARQRYAMDGPADAHTGREILDFVEGDEVRVRLEAERFSAGWVVSYATTCG